jgi:hypothetical protein
MGSDSATARPAESSPGRRSGDDRRSTGIYRWVEILSAVVLSLATVGTAWSGYQASRWGSEQTAHAQSASKAIIRAAHLTDLAEQRLNLQVNLFGQWAAATSTGNTALAGFLIDRFPEPLKSATTAWLATQPLTDPSAPPTPFSMPQYVLTERAEADRWEAIAEAESEAAATASEQSDRYLVFTIVFATVLFFGGISGKFSWLVMDIAALVLGVLALLAGVVILVTLPVK